MPHLNHSHNARKWGNQNTIRQRRAICLPLLKPLSHCHTPKWKSKATNYVLVVYIVAGPEKKITPMPDCRPCIFPVTFGYAHVQGRIRDLVYTMGSTAACTISVQLETGNEGSVRMERMIDTQDQRGLPSTINIPHPPSPISPESGLATPSVPFFSLLSLAQLQRMNGKGCHIDGPRD